MAEDQWAADEGLITLGITMSVEVATDTVVIGSIVTVDTPTTQKLPTVRLCDAGEVPIGVVIQLGDLAGVVGDTVTIALIGSGVIVKIVCGAITAGDKIISGAAGVGAAMLVTPTVAGLKTAVGVALHTSDNAGDEILVALTG